MSGPIPPPAQFPVVRIPVSGPEPFNTLVIVRVEIGSELTGAGLHRFPLTVPTRFKLIGYDPRAEPVYEYSTCGSLYWIGLDDSENEFLVALDEISGSFDDDGTWRLDVWGAHSVGSGGKLIYGFTAVSWVLCYEPPVDPKIPGRRRLSDLSVFYTGS
jgi:hypothetical protein